MRGRWEAQLTTFTGFEVIAIAAIVVLSVVVVGLFLYMIRRFRRRKAQILGELESRPELNRDRAFNRIAMARREATILGGQGVDVRRAQELVGEAQGAFDLGQYDHAYQSAQSAHEALVNARRTGSRSTGITGTTTPLPSSSPTRGSTDPLASSGPSAPAPTPSAAPIPKNRAESQFQMHILADELKALPPRRGKEPAVLEASRLRDQASAAFDKGDYTESFRLALKGRRVIGATVEGLPATAAGAAGGVAAEGNGNTGTSDAAGTAEQVAGGDRCPNCGYPTLPGDAFCRGCGQPKSTPSCATCGAPRAGTEPFCGRCGTRFP